jgi:hypothetical protein
MVMEQITVDRAKNIAKRKGLKPGRVKGTNGVQFTKGRNPRLVDRIRKDVEEEEISSLRKWRMDENNEEEKVNFSFFCFFYFFYVFTLRLFICLFTNLNSLH